MYGGYTATAHDVDFPSDALSGEQELALATANLSVEMDLESRLEEQAELELLDRQLWPLLPHFEARAAKLVGGELAHGAFVGVYQTVRTRVLVYVLQYEDGDVQYLPESEAAAAELLAAQLP